MENAFDRAVFSTNEIVFALGDPGESAFVIEEGCVEILSGLAPDQKRIALLTEGAIFGEIALLDRQPRSASVRALVPTRLIRIDRTHIDEMLTRSDPVVQYLLRLLLARIRNMQDHVGQLIHPRNEDSKAAHNNDADLQKSAVRALSLAQDLADAIDHGQLELHYQPLIAFDGLRLSGFEALVRWRHSALGLVSPDEFIPLAERTGLIHRIGQWVLEQAVSDWSQLRVFCADDTDHTPFMSVNFSAPELARPGIATAIQCCLQRARMPAKELRIELTETVIIQNMESVASTLKELRAMGCGIALDDFGTGYAGLDYLQTLPFTCLKIDKTFVQQIHQSERSSHIIKAALELASSLGLSTIAEGIEDRATGLRLAEMGCSHSQGYFYGKPMPIAGIAEWFSQRG